MGSVLGHDDRGQRTASHLIGSHHAAALTGLILGQVDRSGPDVGAHELVVVAHAAVPVLERRVQVAVERAVKSHEVGPLHAADHLGKGTLGVLLSLHFLFCHRLAVELRESPVASRAAQTGVDTG